MVWKQAQQEGDAVTGHRVLLQVPARRRRRWLALYKKNHNPILEQLIKDGILLSEKLYERSLTRKRPLGISKL